MVVTVSYPKETYFPIKFNGFDVGGLSLTAVVPPGKSIEAVHADLWKRAKALVAVEFAEKLDLYVDRLQEADLAIQKRAFKVGD